MLSSIDNLTQIKIQRKLDDSVTSKASLNSLTTAEPVVRFFQVAYFQNNRWQKIYSLSSDTAKILLQAERKKKRLEKTNKKKKRSSRKGVFGDDITQKVPMVRTSVLGRKISEEIESDLKEEDKRIEKEAQKLLKYIKKMKLKVGQRVPIGSKVTQGKWFIQLVSQNLIILVLTFTGTDEVSVGRLLKKVEFTLKEKEEEMENTKKLKTDIDKVIRNYGFYNFENRNIITGPSRVILGETVLSEEGLVEENMIKKFKTVRKVVNMEKISKQAEMEFKTCDSPVLIKALQDLPKPSNRIEDFFRSERLVTPKKKCPRGLMNLGEISKIDIHKEEFDDNQDDLDFFEFDLKKEEDEEEETYKYPSNTGQTNPNRAVDALCIDLSQKFEKCVFNHKKLKSASKQIKNFDSAHFVNFSASAKKMITVGHRSIAEPLHMRKTSNQLQPKESMATNEKSSNYDKAFFARLGLAILSLLMVIVMVRMFLQLNSSRSSVHRNHVSYRSGN